MRAVGLKVLKNKLSEYVRLAASGETVLVTERDLPPRIRGEVSSSGRPWKGSAPERAGAPRERQWKRK